MASSSDVRRGEMQRQAVKVLGRSGCSLEHREGNWASKHLIECLGILSDESRHVEYSGVSGILY